MDQNNVGSLIYRSNNAFTDIVCNDNKARRRALLFNIYASLPLFIQNRLHFSLHFKMHLPVNGMHSWTLE